MNQNPPRETPGEKVNNMLDGTNDPNRGPVDRMQNAMAGTDDPNRGPLDRTANAVTGGTGGVDRAMDSDRVDGTRGSVVSAVFDSQSEAERAVSELRSAGVSDSALSLIAQSGSTTTTTSGSGEVIDESDGSILKGVLGGGLLGAGLGVAALAIPGIGPLVAAGAIAGSAVPGAAALGAAAGATVGTLTEVLGSHGVDEADADYYGERIKSGGVFVSVDTRTSGVSAETAADILYRNGGHNSSRARVL